MGRGEAASEQHPPERPPTSIFFRFLASRMQTVSFPAVGTYRREMQISPSFSGCQAEQGVEVRALAVPRTAVFGHDHTCRSPQTLLSPGTSWHPVHQHKSLIIGSRTSQAQHSTQDVL